VTADGDARRVTPDTAVPDGESSRWPRWLRRGAIGTAMALVLGAPWLGPPVLAQLDFFHVRRVEFEGLRYTDPAELMALLAIDTTASVWMPFAPIEARVTEHPMITAAHIERRLPSTLVVEVAERLPVALVPGERGLVAVDVAGERLPIDPASAPLDVPVVAETDSALLQLLDQVRAGAPSLWARLSEARREGTREVRLVLDGVTLRARPDVTVARLGDIFPVEADLARRRLRAVELDLRFRDQVIARLP
jgi:cell division protein FtsQ